MFPRIINTCSQGLNVQPNVLLPWAKPTASARCICLSRVKSCLLQSLKHVQPPQTRGLISVICAVSADVGLMSLSSSCLDQHRPVPSQFPLRVWSDGLFPLSNETQVSVNNPLVTFKSNTTPAQIKCGILWLNYRQNGCCMESEPLSGMK